MACSPKPPMKQIQSIECGPFVITSVKSHILPSEGPLRAAYEEQVPLPQFPEMIFHENVIKIHHKAGRWGIAFSALEAMKMIDAERLPEGVKVAAADSWRSSRQDCEFIDKEVVKPFDWTFTSEYKGTVHGEEFVSLIEETEDRIDLEKLKEREKILFYDDVCLYEDELGDNGTSMLSVKIRCMPTSFFLLMRFFLRVDDVLVRIIDTRLYHVAGTSFFLREYLFKEERIENLQHLPPHLLTNPVEIADHLRTIKQINEKLHFPVGS